MSSPLSSSTPKAGPRGKGRPARKGRGKGTAALGGKAAGEESAVSFSPTHSPNESGCAVSLAEKAELQHLNEELETYVNSQEGERSEWESSVREEIMNESFKTQAETVQQYCSKEKAMSEELVELRKALDVEKNAGRRKESELRDLRKEAAKLEEQVTLMRQQVTKTQLQMEEVESEKNQLGSEVSKLREELRKQKSISEGQQQELDSMTCSRNEYRTQWHQTKETLSKKETELYETTERVRAEMRAEENKAVKKHYEAIVAQLTKEKEEAQATLAATLQRIEVLEVEVSQKLEVYQNSAQVEQELVHVRFEHDESKREVGRLQNELTRVETALKEREKEFEKTRQESKEQLLQLKALHQHELVVLKEHQEQQEKLVDHFKAFLGRPLVHDWITLEAEIAKYRRLLGILKVKRPHSPDAHERGHAKKPKVCYLPVKVNSDASHISITNPSNKTHNIGGFVLRHKVDGQEYDYKFGKNFSIKPGVTVKVWGAQAKGSVKNSSTERVSSHVWKTGKSYVTSLLDTDGQEVSAFQYQMVPAAVESTDSDGATMETDSGEEAGGDKKGVVSDEGDHGEGDGEGEGEVTHVLEESGEKGETSGSSSAAVEKEDVPSPPQLEKPNHCSIA